jgi:hypothetical protein
MTGDYGFIYLLANDAMPCYYKIGCTERAPHRRAAELSSGTAVPHPFRVVLYIEVDNFQAREQALHDHLSFRVNTQREFFMFGPQHMPWVYSIFRYYPHCGFTECEWSADLEAAIKHPDVWQEDHDARDGLLLHTPSSPPIGFGELRLVA